MGKLLRFWREYAYLFMLAVMAAGLVYPKVMLVFIICMLAPSVTGLLRGRFWCGNLCPIGNFFDHITIKISNNKKAPDLFKSKYVRSIFLVLMMSMFSFEMIHAFGKPVMMGMIFYEMILEAVIIGTFLSVIYHYRVWCHFCPMGSTGSFTSCLGKKKKVLQVSSRCLSCKKCEDACPMGLSPYKYKGNELSSHDCIQCGKCKNVCADKLIDYDIISK